MPDQAVNADKLKQKMRKMLIITGIFFGLIIAYKLMMGLVLRYFISHQSKVVTVSTMVVKSSVWNSEVAAVGSFRAIRGVNVTTELGGLVTKIFFTPGTDVKQGDILVQLNTDADVAYLHALQANAELALITYNRDQKQFAIKAISKEVLDTDFANLKNIRAQVAQQAATVAKKIIQAPFAGRLGISNINPGQYLNPGDQIVSLQQLDPIWIDFFVPQQWLPRLQKGQTVTITVDALPNQIFTGKVTTINPVVYVNTRNVEVEATLDNKSLRLTPGMFANVVIDIGQPNTYLTVPQTAVTYNPYGNVIYKVVRDKKNSDKNSPPTVAEIFVKTGDTRGDQVAVLSGLAPNDEIVTSGQLKLKNHMAITIDNSITPSDNPHPVLDNNH